MPPKMGRWLCHVKEDDSAKKLMAAVLSDRIPIDWEEARRVAACSKYDCAGGVRGHTDRSRSRTGKTEVLSYVLAHNTVETQILPRLHLDSETVACGPC